MLLSHVLAAYSNVTLPNTLTVDGLCLDSRLVKSGDLFFALAGTHLDGRKFIDEAIQKGAVAVLTEADDLAAMTWQEKIPIISLPHLKNIVGVLAAKFYDFPAQKMRMIGVTGTSGKTSCTQFMGAILEQLNNSCGIIGTLGNGLYGHIHPGQLTTPDAITVQKWLAEFVQHGAQTTAMEVSSHSLDQGRVNGIQFDVGVFTNLTRDHLDYHLTMEAYGAAKKRLFEQAHYAVVNADDAFGQDILYALTGRRNLLAYSIQPANGAALYADDIQMSSSGIKARIISPWGDAELDTALVGQFNLSNLLAVTAALCLIDFPFSSVVASLNRLEPVAGRMQSLGGGDAPLIIVDYAHKPDALEKVLMALRQQCQGKLYCVFGCGGERDRGKRPIMAQIAEQYADQVIVTDDNPRHEDSKQIVADILPGFADAAKVTVQHDRARAIHDVIQFAAKGDCVLIAGKGAETYQQIGDKKLPFSDVEKVQEALRLKSRSL